MNGLFAGWRGRLLVVTLITWPMLGIYMVIDHGLDAPHRVLVMPGWVPFWPAFTIPYLSMLLMTWLLPVFIRDGDRFEACLWGMICGYLLVMPWWVLCPTTLARPPLPSGFWSGPYHWLVLVDPANNVMPCAHGTGPMVAAWFAAQERPAWRGALLWLLGLGLPSIALVWQHRPVDILLGAVAAVIGILAGEAMKRRRGQGRNRSGKE